MALAPWLHRAADRLAMWVEDRVRRAPQPFRPGPDRPAACFGPLPPAPAPPDRPGRWRFDVPAWGGPPEDRAAVRVARARGERRGTAIVVPPWKVPSAAILRGWLADLAAAGLETWLLVPPFHLERTPPGARGGEGFVGNDVGAFRAAVEETVREIRALAAAAARFGPVGLVGLSLGGWPAALAATAEPLAFAALVAPPADPAAVHGATPIGRRYRRLAELAGTPLPPEAELRRLLAPLDPAARRPTARRLLVAAGAFDAIVPPAGPAALARAWGLAPRVFRRGHLTLILACRSLRREVAALARP